MARTASLILLSLLVCSCQTTVVHYEWSADRRHLVRVIEEGIDQFVERDGIAEPAYRAIGVESLVLSSDGAHLVYPGMTAAGWEVVLDGRRSRTWRGIGEITLSKDGAHVAYAAVDDRGWRVVYDGRLGPTVDAVMANTIALSPDGRRLAWVGLRGAASWVFADDQTYGGFSLVGAPRFSSDSKHLAFVAARGRTLRAHLDGEAQQQFEEIVELRFAPDGRLAYLGLRGDRWYAVVDGAIGPPFELLAGLTFSATGRTAYLAKERDHWHALVDGERIATHEEIAHRSICFAGDQLVFAARDGAEWSVAAGPKLAAIEALVCAGDRFAYVGIDREGAFVQLDEMRTSVSNPVPGTLAISADGAHFALLTASPEKGALELVIDGAVRRRFDFEEHAALALKKRRALPEDTLPRWVDAELTMYLEETHEQR